MTTPEENQFDDLLRRAFAGFRAEPDASVWPGIQAAVRPQPPTAWERLRPVGAGILLGALLMGLVPHDQSTPAPTATARTESAPATTVRLAPTTLIPAAESWESPAPKASPLPIAASTLRPTSWAAASHRTTRQASTGARPTSPTVVPVTMVIGATDSRPVSSLVGAPPVRLALPDVAFSTDSLAPRRVGGDVSSPGWALSALWRAGLALDAELRTVLQPTPDESGRMEWLMNGENPMSGSSSATVSPGSVAPYSAAIQRARTLLVPESSETRMRRSLPTERGSMCS